MFPLAPFFCAFCVIVRWRVCPSLSEMKKSEEILLVFLPYVVFIFCLDTLQWRVELVDFFLKGEDGVVLADFDCPPSAFNREG